MQLLEDYDRIRTPHSNIPLQQGITITIEQLSNLLCCTKRNANLIIRKLEDQGYIRWIPGRGRGNRSQLIFCNEIEDIYVKIAKELVYTGKIKAALAHHQKYRHRFPHAYAKFQNWFDTQFGFQQEHYEDKPYDTLRLRIDYEITRIDPAQMYLRSENHIVMHTTDTLLRYDARTNKVIPHLAHHVERDEEGLTWTFFLHKGVQFHDGKELDAQDVSYTFKRLGLVCSPYRWLTANIAHIEVIHAYTLQFQLHSPCYWFDRLSSNPHLSIVQASADGRNRINGELALIGTGPFRLTRNDESMLVLEAFSSYFRQRALLDRVEIWVVPTHKDDQNRMENSYGLQYIPSMEHNLTLEANSRAEMESNRTSVRTECNVTYLSFQQNRDGIVSSPDFRHAISLILDPTAIVHELAGERSEAVNRFFSPNLIKLNATTMGLDEQKRKITALLAKIPYQGESLRLYTFMEADHREDATWIQQRFAKYGIPLSVHYLTPEELLDPSKILEADLVHDSATIGEDAELSLLHVFQSENSLLHMQFSDEQRNLVQQFTLEIFQIKSKGERYERWTTFENELLSHHSYLPLYHNRITMLAQPDLEGVSINAQGWVDYYKLWLRN
ncbi:ABC transporter substrate-binding protein [Paenibacillus sp. N1-5-1-14]|uniref:ABC transporter substrate-binding protein n=1 Tax=Paenibacillus radicibacter TaxID=2972488 RepID=UPI00215954E9|nr:ABC transporter substrate-binding protein [Paenibacillus radicibacter]MCR8643967.1 ABC transporter substrate-binding protein [Paenibacillus radicibacter]